MHEQYHMLLKVNAKLSSCSYIIEVRNLVKFYGDFSIFSFRSIPFLCH